MGNMTSIAMDPADIRAEMLASYHPDCGFRLDNSNSSFAGSFMGMAAPRSCFDDVVLVPLATWILLALLVFVFVPVLFLSRRRARNTAQAIQKTSLQRYSYSQKAWNKRSGFAGDEDAEDGSFGKTSAQAPKSFTQRPAALWTTLSVIYQLLIVAAFLMNILEIVRLALANRGIGLLPFTLAGIILVEIIYHVRYATWVRPITNAMVLAFWVLSLTFTSVQLRTLAILAPVEPRLNTEYHNEDQRIDVGVIVGLYAIFTITELVRLPLSIKEARR